MKSKPYAEILTNDPKVTDQLSKTGWKFKEDTYPLRYNERPKTKIPNPHPAKRKT